VLLEEVSSDLKEALALRSVGDIAAIITHWGEAASSHAASKGFLVDPSVDEFPAYVRALHDAQIEAWRAMLQRLEGEEVPTPADPEPPKAAARPARGKGAPVLLMPTFEAYASAQGISDGVRREWRKYIQNLIGFVGHDDARRLTRDDVVAWRDHLQVTPMRNGELRKAVTVRDKYITALRCTLAWAKEEKRLDENVAADVKVRIPKEAKTRDKDFTMEEATAILKASLEPATGRLSAPYVRARRWIPWLCAYTGARVNELSQLRKEDIFEIEGVWVMRVTPEAGRVKTREARLVPLHPHVIQQGFLGVVEALEAGPIFYDPLNLRVTGDEVKGNRHVKKVGERLGEWVRKEVGITDKAIKPNHAWRHLFKTISADAGIEERVADAIQGHAPGTTGRKYGKISVQAKAAALGKIPYFHVVPPPADPGLAPTNSQTIGRL
jgi:integrase